MLTLFKKGAFPFFTLIFLLSSSLCADALYILGDRTLLLEKAGMKIIEISSEIKEKTGVSLYVSAVETLDGVELKEYEASDIKRLNEPYIWLYFVKDIKKINILHSKELDGKIDKNSVFWDYIMPLIPKKDYDLTNERVSAALFNGYMEITEQIADSYKVELKSAVKSEKWLMDDIAKYAMYFMLATLVAIVAVVYLRKSK